MAQNSRGGVKACALCHKKKVRCVLEPGGTACRNCLQYGIACSPHIRRRASYVGSSHVDSHSRQGASLMSPAGSASSPAVAMQELPMVYSATPERQIATSQTYLGRSGYLRGDVPFVEDMEEDPQGADPASTAVIYPPQSPYVRFDAWHDLPSRSVRAGLIDSFMERCHPWMPIVERPWLEENEKNPPSMLLLNAVLLSGCRVSSGDIGSISPQHFYERAKALFFYGSERNAVLVIVAACLLNWWSPTGPEQISLNTSGFWISVSAFLAYQVGLHIDPGSSTDDGFRRRLWWSLRSRDNLISVAVGRPRMINARETDVRPVSLEDFNKSDIRAHLFCAYAPICTLLGDIAEAHRLRALSNHSRAEFDNALLQWAKSVSPQLRISRLEHGLPLCRYNNEAWQLWVPYLVCLLILQRTSNPKSANSTACLVASSLIAGIFEDFLVRDHIKYLPPVWAFYALAAGLCQLTGYRYSNLRETAERDIQVLCQALEKLGERWGSAKSALNSLTRATTAVTHLLEVDAHPEPLHPSMRAHFNHLSPSLCRIWRLLGLDNSCYNSSARMSDQAQQAAAMVPENIGFDGTQQISTHNGDGQAHALTDMSQMNAERGHENAYPMEYDNMFPIFETSIQPTGSWFFESFGMLPAGVEARQATLI